MVLSLVLVPGLWALGSGPWALGLGLWALGSGLWALGSGPWALRVTGLWALGPGLWALGPGLMDLGSGLSRSPSLHNYRSFVFICLSLSPTLSHSFSLMFLLTFSLPNFLSLSLSLFPTLYLFLAPSLLSANLMPPSRHAAPLSATKLPRLRRHPRAACAPRACARGAEERFWRTPRNRPPGSGKNLGYCEGALCPLITYCGRPNPSDNASTATAGVHRAHPRRRYCGV